VYEEPLGHLPREIAALRTCPMVVVTDVDGTLRDPFTRETGPAGWAEAILGSMSGPRP